MTFTVVFISIPFDSRALREFFYAFKTSKEILYYFIRYFVTLLHIYGLVF